jgi:hypothetical protein
VRQETLQLVTLAKTFSPDRRHFCENPHLIFYGAVSGGLP